jgi:hypothetical protein
VRRITPKNTDQVPLDYNRLHMITDMGLLLPSQATPIGCFGGGTEDQRDTLTQTQVDDLLNGRAYIGIYGQARFVDIFGNPHWVRFCSWKNYYKGNGNFNAKSCVDYNDAGDGQLPYPRLKRSSLNLFRVRWWRILSEELAYHGCTSAASASTEIIEEELL